MNKQPGKEGEQPEVNSKAKKKCPYTNHQLRSAWISGYLTAESGGEEKRFTLTVEQMKDIFRAGAGYALNQFKEPNAQQYFKDKFNIDL